MTEAVDLHLKPIGWVHCPADNTPRHWTVSDLEGELYVEPRYLEGLKDIRPGQKIVVIFYFHKSPDFNDRFLVQKPPHLSRKLGVFSTCSPRRPNPIGMSVLKVLGIRDNVIRVKGLDMLDNTPILDIKPYIRPRGDDDPND